MIIKHKINMDLVRREEEKYIDVMQDDKYSRDLELVLKSNLKIFCPPEGCTVLMRYIKPKQAMDSTDPYNSTGYKNGYYLSSNSPFEGADSTTVLTGYIPYSVNTTGVPGTIYVRGAAWDAISHCRLYFFDDTKSTIKGPQISGSGSGNAALTTHFTVETLGENYYKLTPIANSSGNWVTIALVATAVNVAYMRMSLVGTGENLIVTVDEPIEE